MNAQLEKLQDLCKSLRLEPLSANEMSAQLNGEMSPLSTLIEFLSIQNQRRQEKAAAARIRNARFPGIKTLEGYDFKLQDGVTAEQMKRLCDFVWVASAFVQCCVSGCARRR